MRVRANAHYRRRGKNELGYRQLRDVVTDDIPAFVQI